MRRYVRDHMDPPLTRIRRAPDPPAYTGRCLFGAKVHADLNPPQFYRHTETLQRTNDDVMTYKRFPHYWSSVMGIHHQPSPLWSSDSLHKGAVMRDFEVFFFMLTWTSCRTNNNMIYIPQYNNYTKRLHLNFFNCIWHLKDSGIEQWAWAQGLQRRQNCYRI